MAFERAPADGGANAEGRSEWHQVILDALPDKIVVLDAAGTIVVANKACSRGNDGDRLIDVAHDVGINYLAACEGVTGPAADDARAICVGIGRVLRGESPAHVMEYSCPTPAEARWFRLTAHGLVRAGQAGAVVIHSEITERKAIEERLLRSQRLESLGTLAGGIAHDLNNVLAPIMMAVHLLAEKETDPDSQRLVANMGRSVERGAAMVRQVLSFSRGFAGERSIVEVRRLVGEIAEIIRETFPKNIILKVNLPSNLWTMIGEPTQLHQVLLNLCVNARDAMPGGGSLTIAAENVVLDESYAALNPDARVGPHLMLQVADTGTGIPPEIRHQIFDLFFTTKPVGKGTGLGLSTTLSIIKSHHGFINVYSEVGRGSTFKVYIPAENARAEQVLSIEQNTLPAGRGELILVIDDEEIVSDTCRRALERHGYRALVATDGASGVALYAQQRDQIAVVITDMMMPIMDGPATIYALRRINPDVRIIASSGLSTNSKLAQIADSGVVHFLHKPYTAERLLHTLRRALPESGSGSPFTPVNPS